MFTRKHSITDPLSRFFWPMNAEILRKRAELRSGLHDFGDPPLEPAFTTLVDSLERDADLHPLGRFLMWNHLEEMLVLRLRLVDQWKRRSGRWERGRIVKPLFITGMPRSGSTFLHDLLCVDPANRAPRVWEVMFPLSVTRKASQTFNWKIWNASMRLWLFRKIVPMADSVHPIRATSPQECEAIHSFTFYSEEFITTNWLPEYETFLRHTDFNPTYEWQKRFMLYLQGEETNVRWVLKSPDHSHNLDALFTVFPDAVIIQTHRNPREVLESSLRLVEALHRLYAYSDGKEERMRREVRVLAEAMERLLRFRDSHPELESRFLDVRYPDLVSNPLGIVKRIYDHWGYELSPETLESMESLASSRSRYPVKKREHSRGLPADNAITELSLFKRYCARFGYNCQSEKPIRLASNGQ
jgi:hypothetical protein